MNERREERSVMTEVIVSHAWREKVGTLIKKLNRGTGFPRVSGDSLKCPSDSRQ